VTERERIVNLVNDLFIAVDNRDWEAARQAFAPEVRFDMTSLAGGEPAVLPREQIIAGWEEGLRPMRAIHHQAGNYRVRVRGDKADAFCYATAFHLLPEGTPARGRMFVGSYDYTLERRDGRWQISGFRFNCKFVDPTL
jgi:hypothetical protein